MHIRLPPDVFASFSYNLFSAREPKCTFCSFSFFFFILKIHLFEREKKKQKHESGGVGRGRENPKQTPH